MVILLTDLAKENKELLEPLKEVPIGDIMKLVESELVTKTD